MATIIAQVDRQSGNYEQVFVYSVNASFNGISGDINSAKIRIFIPDYLTVFLGDVQEPIKQVTQIDTPLGVEYEFDFGSITDLGIAVRFGFGVTFKLEADNGSGYMCSPVMIINGEELTTASSDEIRLEVSPQFELTREIVLPMSAPSYGSAVYFKVSLQNFGDLGAEIKNVEMNFSSMDNLVIDDEYEVIGKDVSTKFQDESADNIEGIYENGNLKFIIPSYRGEIYEFIYRAVVDENLQVGEEIVSIANWSIDSVSQVDEVTDITLAEPIFDAQISLYVPDYSLPNEYICFRMGLSNSGNQILTNAIFENNLPTGVEYYQLSTGAFHIGAIEKDISAQYYIDYMTVNGVEGELGPFNTDVSSTVNLSELIELGDQLTALYWKLDAISIGLQTKASPQLLGTVKADVELDSSLLDHIHLSYDTNGERREQVVNETTLIANYCTLRPTLSSSVAENPIRPNDIVRLTFNVNCRNSRLRNPILACLLPKEFLYVGNEQYRYTDIFAEISPPEPSVKIVENFNDDNDMLVKFEFVGDDAFDFRQLATIKISFDVKVAIGAYGEVSTFLLLNTKGSSGVIPNNIDVYVDSDDIANDVTVSSNYAKSNIIDNRILYFVSTSSNKKVKGLLDSVYMEEPDIGRTVNGGSLEYLITVKNIGNADLEDIEVVDILPYIGDIGVIETKRNRDSEFAVYALSEVAAVIMPFEEVGFDILYSTSTDPVRFGANFDIIGSDDNWTEKPPEDLSFLRAFKVKIKDRVLRPSETLKVAVTASVPVGVNANAVAWNSFAADVSYTDLNGQKQHLLAIEPEKVGILIEESAEETVKISGYSWVDENADGYNSNGEPFVNDVAVVLYNESGEQIRYTSTRTDASGNDGQYLFDSLAAGKYYLRFFIDTNKLRFTKKIEEGDNTSKANSNGVTALLDLTNTKELSNVNVGIVPKGKYGLDDIMKINNQVRGVVRDVIKNQMLLTMKQEDVIELIEKSQKGN